jgi:hypothetical protein
MSEMFRSDINALVAHKFLVKDDLPPAAETNSYQNVTKALHLNAQFLRDNWSTVNGNCALKPADVDNALELCSHVESMLGDRTTAQSVARQSAKVRQQCLTATVRAYNQVRRVMGYVRYDNDEFETIVPSLYAVARPSHRSSSNSTTATATAPAPTATPSAATPAAPAAAAKSPAAPQTSNGGPGGNPFMD